MPMGPHPSGPLSQSHYRPLFDLLLLAEKIVDFRLQFSNLLLLPLCRRLPMRDKAIDQQVLEFRNPRAFLWLNSPLCWLIRFLRPKEIFWRSGQRKREIMSSYTRFCYAILFRARDSLSPEAVEIFRKP